MKLIVLDIMRFKGYLLIYLSLFFTLSGISFAQEKYEREFKISKDEFPVSSLNTLKSVLGTTSINYYKEIDNTKISFEAKFKYQKEVYSVEFDKTGVLEDIEILIKNKEFNALNTKVITNYFSSRYDKFKFFKIQLQYINQGSVKGSNLLEKVIADRGALDHNYEIVARVKANQKAILKEFVFNSKGQLLSERRINTSGYDHILY